MFLIWNSINDPLFGYLFDRHLLLGKQLSKKSIVRSKIEKVRIFGPCLALAFYMFWSPVFTPELNFVIGKFFMPKSDCTEILFLKNWKALCLYDGFLTVVDLSLSSIMSDYTTSNVKRARLSKARSVGNILASFIVFLSYCVWDRDDIESFKVSLWRIHENSRFSALLLHHCRPIISWFLFWKLLPAGQPTLTWWNEFAANRWKVKFVQRCLQIHGSTVPNA